MGAPFFVSKRFALPASIIYLDESGDLGWSFDHPYRAGGSSRHLTIAALCVPTEKKHIPKRVMKNLYNTFQWPYQEEKKWSVMNRDERSAFAKAAHDMCEQHKDIHLHTLTVKKQNVGVHIQRDANKLYNYMIKLCLLGRMSEYDAVTLVPDQRSIKVKSGNSLHDYLQTELWLSKKVATLLSTHPLESKNCLAIQFADMLAGLVQARFEDDYLDDIRIIYSKAMAITTLFFGP